MLQERIKKAKPRSELTTEEAKRLAKLETIADKLKRGENVQNRQLQTWLSEDIWFDGRAECPIVNELRKEKISTFKDKKIFIISSNYNLFKRPKLRTSAPLEDGRNRVRMSDRVDEKLAWTSYANNIKWLIELGHTVVLIGILPTPSINAQVWIMDNKHLVKSSSYPNVYNQTSAAKLKKRNIEKFLDIKSANLFFIDPSEILCDASTDRCLDVMEGLGPLYNGGGHLSYFGADLIARRVQRLLVNYE